MGKEEESMRGLNWPLTSKGLEATSLKSLFFLRHEEGFPLS